MRKERVEASHQAVPGDLRNDGGGRDCRALLVAVHDRGVRRRSGTKAEAVDEARLGRWGQCGQHRAEPVEVAAVQPTAVDLAGRDKPYGDPVGAGYDRPEELLAPLGRKLLRIV